MRLVRVKISDGEYVNLVYDVTTDSWKARIQAPSRTSYSQPGHYYPVIIDLWDDDNVHTVIDDTDPTFGNNLKLRVRERVEPVIHIYSPTDGEIIPIYYEGTQNYHNIYVSLQFSDIGTGGSGIDTDSIRVYFAGNEYTKDSEGVTFEQIGGVDSYRWTQNIPVTESVVWEGYHELSVKVQDNDGNEIIESVVFYIRANPVEFIYDRTQADVDRVKELTEKYLNGTITAAEKQEFAEDLKGARNKSDFLRILNTAKWIAEYNFIDFSTIFDHGIQYQDLPTFPNTSWVQDVLDCVAALRSQLPLNINTPSVPAIPLNTYKKMNDIEKILYDLYKNCEYVVYYYVNDSVYCDGEIGLLE